jgi:hypothetical protein
VCLAGQKRRCRIKGSATLHVSGKIFMCQVEWLRIVRTQAILYTRIRGTSTFPIRHKRFNLTNAPGGRPNQEHLCILCAITKKSSYRVWCSICTFIIFDGCAFSVGCTVARVGHLPNSYKPAVRLLSSQLCQPPTFVHDCWELWPVLELPSNTTTSSTTRPLFRLPYSELLCFIRIPPTM